MVAPLLRWDMMFSFAPAGANFASGPSRS